MLKGVGVFGSVKGKNCIVLFGRIKVGILLFRINGGIEDGIGDERGKCFCFWLWSGEDGGEGNLFVR